jgi:hypothetical protein
MRVYEKYVDFSFQHRNESDSECFDNRSKTFVLHDNKLVNRRLNIFDFLESVLNDELVNDCKSNHCRVDLFDFSEDCVLCRD